MLEETKEEVPAAKPDEDTQSTVTVTTAATEQTESAPVQSEDPEKEEVVTEASAALSLTFACVGEEKEQQERKEKVSTVRPQGMGEVNVNDSLPDTPCPDPALLRAQGLLIVLCVKV